MKNIKLYNVMFPVWMLVFMPPLILLTIPVNFIWDSAVLIFAAHFILKGQEKETWKKAILPVFLLGFLADFISVGLLFGGLYAFTDTTFEDIYSHAVSLPFSSVGAFFIMLFFVLIAGGLIYIFNYKLSFKKLDLADSEKKRMALVLAVLTAPWTFFIQYY